MKVYIDWREWYPFPFLYTKSTWTGDTPVEIPDELHKRWHDTTGELETIVKELDRLQKERR